MRILCQTMGSKYSRLDENFVPIQGLMRILCQAMGSKYSRLDENFVPNYGKQVFKA
uniref:Pto-like serine/threonine kinase n=1 Tax=Manihot esculenta TaxID=3983 RepID=Q5XNQ6_MANES|nr:Pto-like serine/threonine kinase [Manihot esculenta]